MAKLYSNYPYSVEVVVRDQQGNSVSDKRVACFLTLGQAKAAQDAAAEMAYELEPDDIETA